MVVSSILSKLSRLALLSVFCAGLFLTSGELSLSNSGMQIQGGGVVAEVAAETTPPSNTPETTAKKNPIDDTINSVITGMNLIIGILTALITPLIMLAGWLLSPDWTFGEIFGLRPILHQLWILISNVVYVIFGFMLVFVAFANIFGGEHSKAYEMKTMLPKLVTGMLMVPFTWFIVSATLSISNILTASVIQLPVSTILNSGGDTKGLLTDKIIPKEITFDKNADSSDGTVDSNGKSLSDAEKNKVDADGKSTTAYTKNGNFYASDCDDDENQCLSIKEFLTGGGGGAYNLLSVYAYGIFRIQEYKAITTEQKISKALDIAYKLGYGVVFFIIFGILIIAIVYALFSRAMMLWLYAMFSPLFALMYVTGSKHKSLEKFSIKEFISLAMVPVYVSAALAFGLMFLGLVMSATGTAAKTGDGKLEGDSVKIETKDTTTSFQFGTGDNGITLKTVGLLDPEAKNGTSKALDIGKGIIGTIIMNILALVILWMAVMAALDANKITGAAVKPIADMGNSVGGLIKSAPQYIPIPGTGGQSMGSLAGGTQQIANYYGQQAMGKKASEFSQRFTDPEYAKRTQEWNTINNYGENILRDDAKLQLLRNQVGGKSPADLSKDVLTRSEMAKLASKLGIKDKDGKVITDEGLKDSRQMKELLKSIHDLTVTKNSPKHFFRDENGQVGIGNVDADTLNMRAQPTTPPAAGAPAAAAVSPAITIAPTNITVNGATTQPITISAAATPGAKQTIKDADLIELLKELNETNPRLTKEQLVAELAKKNIEVHG